MYVFVSFKCWLDSVETLKGTILYDTILRCLNKIILVWEFSVIMFEIIIILLMKNKYLMFLPPPTTNIYILYRERERTNQDGAMLYPAVLIIIWLL